MKSFQDKLREPLFAHPLLLRAIPSGVRVFGRRKRNLRVPRRWEGDHFWVRFTPKLHHVLIKPIRMLDTLLLSTNEVEAITKESIRSNSKSLQQCMTAVLFPQCSRRSRLSRFPFIFYFALTPLCFRGCWGALALSRNGLIRRLSKIFAAISSKTARCWRCKGDTWSLVWHGVAKATPGVWRLTLDNPYR